METIVYLIRHAKCLNKGYYNEYELSKGDWQLKNERNILSVNGEKDAEKLSELDLLANVSAIYSSNYIRCISTAKYLAEKLDIPINISERLQERIHGDISDFNPKTFYYNQHHNFDFKLPKGESINDTKNRIIKVFNDIVFANYGSEIAIFTHEHSIMSFLTHYCDIAYNLEDELVLSFQGNNFTMPLSSPDIFKITLEDNEVINIEKK